MKTRAQIKRETVESLDALIWVFNTVIVVCLFGLALAVGWLLWSP